MRRSCVLPTEDGVIGGWCGCNPDHMHLVEIGGSWGVWGSGRCRIPEGGNFGCGPGHGVFLEVSRFKRILLAYANRYIRNQCK